jgi:RNA polymerase sigma-70 factor, ECF subfamily
MHTTPVSLLEQLRQPNHPVAWERFVLLYTPLLSHWVRRLGLEGQDAADLIQDVFTLLVQKLPDFRYDPDKRFSGWLWTVTLNRWREKQRCDRRSNSNTDPDVLTQISVPDSAETFVEEEYRQYLTRRALVLMQAEFQPATWKAFWECVVNERSASEVGLELGLTENAVYLAKGRVLRRLRLELEGLLE